MKPTLEEVEKLIFGMLITRRGVKEVAQSVHALYNPPMKPLSEIVKNRNDLKELFKFVTGSRLKNKQTSDNKKFCVMYSGTESPSFFTLYFDGSILHSRDLKPGVTYFDVVDKIRSLGYNINPNEIEKSPQKTGCRCIDNPGTRCFFPCEYQRKLQGFNPNEKQG